jgi:hypothetical protein
MKSKKEIASEILAKYEDKNEYHFHAVDREWIIEAMLEFKRNFVPKTIDLRGPSVRTGASWLTKLPDEVQVMWRHDVVKLRGEADVEWLLKGTDTFSGFIAGSFVWKKSSQGYDFWYNISKGKFVTKYYVPLQ